MRGIKHLQFLENESASLLILAGAPPHRGTEGMIIFLRLRIVSRRLSSPPERRYSVIKPLAENTINSIDCSFASLQRAGGKRSAALQENTRRVNELQI